MADTADRNIQVAPGTGRDNAKIPQTAEELERLLDELGAAEGFDPPPEFRARARVTDPEVYAAAARDPEGYWAGRARELHWDTPFTSVLDESEAPFVTWFADGTLNASYNCLDRHVEAGLGERVAFHWRGEEGEERDITYADLLRDVQLLANGLKELGIGRGDVVGIFLPMIPEVVVAMLACARIGAPHNVVFGGFAPGSVRERMEVSNAKALITVDGARRKGKTAAIKPEVDRVMAGLAELRSIVVVRHTGTDCAMQEGRDVFYDELLARSEPICPAEPLPSEHPLFILYSSGSTAKPKGILHTTGGYLTGVAATHRDVFDLQADSDVFWCTADVGWVTGHSYIVYGPLANGCTSVMFEGAPDYPAKDVWWEIIERYGVTIFYTAPTAIRVCMKWGVEHPNSRDLSSLRLLGSVGEPINPKAWLWYYAVVGHQQCPVVDTWWQTETGHIMIAPLPGLTATKPGSATRPLPGVSAALVDIDGNEMDEGTGLLVLTRPWPGMLRTLVGDDERFVSTYFERFGPRTYVVGDAARKDGDGYFWIIGRTDDVINVSGHRLSTAEVESAIVAHPKVAEAAVVAEADALSGQAIVAFVTLNAGLRGDDQAAVEIRAYVGERIGKLARPKSIIWADDLPKTRSGKIMRRLLRDIAEGRELGDVTTLGDPSILRGLQEKAAARGTTSA